MPIDKEGLGGNVIFIDSENTFRPERIHQIAENRGMHDPEQILRKIYVCKIFNSSHLELIIQNLGKSIQEYKAKLVIVDSIISLHRAEFTGRGTLEPGSSGSISSYISFSDWLRCTISRLLLRIKSKASQIIFLAEVAMLFEPRAAT